jgi:tryptophanase
MSTYTLRQATEADCEFLYQLHKAMHFKTIIEPFRIKTVDPFARPPARARSGCCAKPATTCSCCKAEDVLIDLLTDSGTGAMSSGQWAGMMLGDESYAGAKSFYKFEAAVRASPASSTSSPPTRAAPPSASSSAPLLKPGDIVPTTPTSTPRAPTSSTAAPTALDIPNAEGRTAGPRSCPSRATSTWTRWSAPDRAKGRAPLAMITVTNNSGGGQPVSMANIRAASEICRRHGVPSSSTPAASPRTPGSSRLREEGYADKTPLDIAQEMFSYADGCTMSAKKDGMANIGGFLALNDDALAQSAATCSSSPRASPPTAGWPATTWRPSPSGWRRCCTRTTCATASAPWPTWATS